MKKVLVVIVFLIILGVAMYLGYVRSQVDQETVKGVETSAPAGAVTVTETVPPSQTGTPAAEVTRSMKQKTYSAPPPMTINATKKYAATIKTSKGAMKLILDPSVAPVAVNNFVFLARDGFYNDTVFHRIIKGFMVQGGDPKGNGTGGPGYRFDDEKVTKEYSRGTIAMANAGPNTNGSQFFIMHADYALPKNYVIFGSIVPDDSESLATLDAIATTPTSVSPMGEQSTPVAPVALVSVSIEER